MIALGPWGGYSNGAIPAAALVQAEGGIPGDLLEPTTSTAWARWRAAVGARTGVWLQLDHSDLINPGYRPIANQKVAWDRYQRDGRPVASHPPDATHNGSNHGWGRALDCTGFENRPDVWRAMNDLAPQFGLSNETGRASGERWHWECLNPPMVLSANSVRIILHSIRSTSMYRAFDTDGGGHLFTDNGVASLTGGTGGTDELFFRLINSDQSKRDPEAVGQPGTREKFALAEIVQMGNVLASMRH